MSMNDERFDQLLWEMAHNEETPLPPGLDGRLEEIYARLEQENGPRTQKEEKPVKRKILTLARAAVFAAVVALMAVSVTVGALAFSTETIVEVEVPVPVEQETIVMDDIGITLILPDSWKDKYVAVMSDNDEYRCRVYAKSTYDWCMAHEDFNDGSVPYMGFVFSVTRWYDEPMTPEEFYDRHPLPAIYLMSTEEGTYSLGRPSDVQTFGYGDCIEGLLTAEEADAYYEDWTTMNEEIKDIQVVLNGVMEGALNRNGYSSASLCASVAGQVGDEEVKGQFRRLELSFAGKAMVLSGQTHKLSVRVDLCRLPAARDIYHLIRIAVNDEDRPVIGGNFLPDIKVQQLFGIGPSDFSVERFVCFGNF